MPYTLDLSMPLIPTRFSLFFFNDTATTEIYTLSLHDALPIWGDHPCLTACLTVMRTRARGSPARRWPERRPTQGPAARHHRSGRFMLTGSRVATSVPTGPTR